MSRLLMHQTEDHLKHIMVDSQTGKREAYRETLQYILARTQDYCLEHGLNDEVTQVVIATVLLLTHELRHTYDPGRSFNRWADAIVEHARNRVNCAQSVGPSWASYRHPPADGGQGQIIASLGRRKAAATDGGEQSAHVREAAHPIFHFMEGSL
jgi:hypothetical protein